jgi:hypothetical protein
MAVGRATDARSVTATRTNASPTITAAAGTFHKGDIGRTVTGTGVPANTTISAVASGTSATLSANATASGSSSLALGESTGDSYGHRGWSPETDAEAASYSVTANRTGVVAPDRVTSPNSPVAPQRARD